MFIEEDKDDDDEEEEEEVMRLFVEEEGMEERELRERRERKACGNRSDSREEGLRAATERANADILEERSRRGGGKRTGS